MEQETTVKLTELEARAVGNTRRIETLERGQEALNRLATAVEVLATRQESMGENVGRLNEKLDALETRPVKRWDSLIDKLLLALAGAFAAFLLTGGGV